MKSSRFSTKRHFSLAKLLGLGLAALGASAQPGMATTYTWADSNVNTTGSATLDWFSGGPNTQGVWTPTAPTSGAGSNADTYQFFAGTTTAFTNTTAVAQTSNVNNGGVARQLGVLSLEGLGSATTGASVTLTISGDPLDFSGSTGTLNLDALVGTGGVIYNVNSGLQLGTASSGSVLTLQGNGTGTFNIGGVISELQAGGGSLVKAGSSSVTLTGTETYSGATTVNGGTLTLQGAGTAGSILNSTAVNIGQGATFFLKNDATNGVSTNRVADTTAITTNGGAFNFGASTAASTIFSETVGQLNVASGGNRVVTTAATGTGSSSTLTFASLNRTAGATLNFATATNLSAAANQILFTTAPTVDGGNLIGGWATVGSADFAAYGANGVAVATYNTGAETTWTATDNIKFTLAAGGSVTLTANRDVNAVAYVQSGSSTSTTLNLGGFTLRVRSGGVLVSGGTSNGLISNGSLTAGNGDNTAGVLYLMGSQANTRPYTVSANIVNNGTGVVSVVANAAVTTTGTGTGQVVLSGTNTYTGTTTVAGGYLTLGSSTALNNSKGLTLAAGTTLEMSGFTATVDGLFGSGAISVKNSSGSATNGSTIIMGNGNGSATFTGSFDVAGSAGRNLILVKNGTGTQVIAGSDFRDTTTSGGASTTTVNAGVLQFAKTVSFYNSNSARYVATNIIVNNGGTLALNVGGTGEYTSANVDTIRAIGTATGGFQSGSYIGLDTTNAAGGTFTYSSSFGNPNAGANTLGLTKLGSGTLALTGANSYTGLTNINSGTLNINGQFALGGSVYSGLNFNGGTLQYAAALSGANGSGDVSADSTGAAKPVTINAGGATIDANGNAITFANAIGNNGAGALTVKSTLTGGSLTLSAPSTYTGGTTVSTGALTLTATGTLGSGNVTVGAGATLTLGSTNNAIGDTATLTFGAGSAIVGNVAGTETLGAITNGTLTLNGANQTQSTYSAADLNTYFGGSSFSGAEIYAFAAVPEPSTYFGGALLVGVAGWSLRRRFAAGKLAAAI